MTSAHGIKSLASLRSRAVAVEFGGHALLIADLSDIIKSKRLAGRDKDRAVMPLLEEAFRVRQGR